MASTVFSAITKLVKRFNLVLVPLVSVILALTVGAIIIAALGLSPMKAYACLWQGSFGSVNSIGESIVKMTPLVFTGLSFALGRRCGVTNLGAEGQLFMGALGATAVGIFLKGLPMAIHIPLAIVVSFLCGGLWGFFAGGLKVKFGASEIITTIMLNHIARNFVNYMVTGPMIEPPGNWPQTAQVEPSAVLPKLISGTRIHLGIVIAVLFAIFVYYFLWKTTKGFETRVVGFNSEAARYAGIKPKSTILFAMFFAGGLAGLAGATEILGVQFRLIQDFSANVGFEGIAVALLGRNNPFGVLISAILFGALKAGSNTMQLLAKIPAALAYIIQALVILFILASGLYEILKRKSEIRGGEKQCIKR
ncbi:MAG: ABC transporter permease [Bacillota bacterium]